MSDDTSRRACGDARRKAALDLFTSRPSAKTIAVILTEATSYGGVKGHPEAEQIRQKLDEPSWCRAGGHFRSRRVLALSTVCAALTRSAT